MAFDVFTRMAPVALCFQISQRSFARFARDNARHAGGNLSGDELVSAARRFVIEENSTASVQSICLTVIARQLEPATLLIPYVDRGWNPCAQSAATSSALPNISLDPAK